MKVTFWGYDFDVDGPYLGCDLRESNGILDEPHMLQDRLQDDGYLLIRQLRNRDAVIAARDQILEQLAKQDAIEPGTLISEGIVNRLAGPPATTGVRGNEGLRHLSAVAALPKSLDVLGFFERLLGGPASALNFQWLRVAGPGAASAIHSDVVFMGRGTHNLYTCWTPLTDVSIDMGPVILCLGSHRFAALRDTYWKADVDRDLIEGHLSKDPMEIIEKFGGRWATTEFRAGDVLIFGMHILHASLSNISNRYRISMDARYQLASEPFDERWVGDHPPTHYNFWKPNASLEPLEQSRRRWGI